MRSFAGMFVGGVAAVLLLKVLAGFVLTVGHSHRRRLP